jgi:hypothetical protein
MGGFQLVEGTAKGLGLVGADPFDEIHQRRLPAPGI